VRFGQEARWHERGLFERYNPNLPDVPVEDMRPVLEASPFYLTGMPDSYEDLTRFPRFIPGVKMIALVRNPVERAFSEYLMLSERPWRRGTRGCKFGHNYTFEALAEEELALRSPELLQVHTKNACLKESTKWQPVASLPNGTSRFQGRLLGWSEYARFAEPWMRVLSPEQLLFVKTEDLEDEPERTTAEILEWAGLRPMPLRVRRSNTAACRGSHARGAFDPAREAAIESGGCEGPGDNSPQAAMDPAMAATLHAHFRKHNADFARLTGMDTSIWDTSKHLAAAAAA
jgi:hypothetical protein